MSFNIKSDRGTWPYDVAATCSGKVRTPCDGGYVSEIRYPKMCALFKPGHNPHWIQINRAVGDRDDPPTPGRFAESRPDGSVVIEVDGHELNLWNHEPERLDEAAAASGGVVEYQPQWGLLWVPSNSGRYAFCVTRLPNDQLPCPMQLAVGDPMKLLEESGGFILPEGELWREDRSPSYGASEHLSDRFDLTAEFKAKAVL